MNDTSKLEHIHRFDDMLQFIVEHLPPEIQWSSNDHWICFTPNLLELPKQGWKIHLSVVPAQGTELLKRIAFFLIGQRVQWKVVNNERKLIGASDGSIPLSQTGKCVTIYTPDEDCLVELLHKLYVMTDHLEGPVIPTDLAYLDSSCVYFRYGAFTDRFYYDSYTSMKINSLLNPDGELEEDQRIPGRYKPEWIKLPEAIQDRMNSRLPEASSNMKKTHSVLLAESERVNPFAERNLRVIKVLKKSGKGGVFLVSTRNLRSAVMKEATNRMRVDRYGRSCHDYLSNEFNMLKRLEHTGVVPKAFEQFSQQQNSYLLIEYFQGVSLREFVYKGLLTAELDFTGLFPICEQLLDLVSLCHQSGVAINDLTPNNIVVLPDGSLRLIDLELACNLNPSPGEEFLPLRGYTPGYVRRGSEHDPAPGIENDIYAMGAVLFYMATSIDPYLKYLDQLLACCRSYLDEIPDKGLGELGKLGVQLMQGEIRSVDSARHELQQIQVRMLMTGLLDNYSPGFEGEQVQKIQQVQDAMNKTENSRWMDGGQVLKQARQMVQKWVSDLQWESSHALYPENSMSRMFHPLNFNFGWTGMVHVLNQLGRIDNNLSFHNHAYQALQWMIKRYPFVQEETPQALYFGYGSVPWLLADTARRLGDRGGMAQAEHMALQVTAHTPIQTNISHGSAGLGLMLLGVHEAVGGSNLLLERAEQLAEHILHEEERVNDLSLWLLKEKTQRKNQLRQSLGYSHGVAGIGYFLLAMYHKTNGLRYRQAVTRIVETLEKTAYQGRYGYLWPAFAEKKDKLWVHWCNGSAGIGRFLFSVADVLSDPNAARLAMGAADAVASSSIFGTFGQCHGLAGNGDFLLLADRYHPGRYRPKLWNIACMLNTLKSDQSEQWKWPLEDMETFAPDYMTGYAGVYSFLLRLYHPVPGDEPLVYQGFHIQKEEEGYAASKHY